MRHLALALIVLVMVLSACKKDDPKIAFEDLPQGNATRGAEIFIKGSNTATNCSTCHRTDDTDITGPHFENLRERAAKRVDGMSAEEYIYTSILRPAKYLVTGYSNLMPNDYEEKLSAQDIADLIAYLMSL